MGSAVAGSVAAGTEPAGAGADTAMFHPRRRAEEWLAHTYGGLVELTVPDPVHETPAAWLMTCRTLPQPGFPRTPMLAASLVVPRHGGPPFHPAPGAPLADLEPAPGHVYADRAVSQPRRINARGCVAAVHHAIDGARSTAVPWSPAHEAPGWWGRLARRYFPGFDGVPPAHRADWNDVAAAMTAPGPGTRGVVWVRRELDGHEITGNLLYVHNNDGRVVFLDPLESSLARLDTSGVRELRVLRLPGDAKRAEPPPTA